MTLEDSVAIVTGASSGIGEATAKVLGREGCAVALVARREERLEAIADGIDARTLVVPTDVSDEEQAEAMVEEVRSELGEVDVLVNNAGIWSVADLLEMDETTWDAVVETDLKGAWLAAKHVGRHFAQRDEGGRIVTTGSTASLVGTPGSGHYAAAKHGVVGLTKTLALELAPYGVTANAVCPTGVETPLVDGIAEAVGEEALARVSAASGPMNVVDEQLLDPEDVAEAVLWLASDAARYVTGVVLPVDAGMTAK